VVLTACESEQQVDPEQAAESIGAAPTGERIAAVADVPVGGAASATLNGQPVLVTQPEEGEFRAFSAICTHQGCTVAPGDGVLECPCHRSTFALADAAVLGGPAQEPLPEVSVTVVDGDVVVS
jgi:Rieske Fe-S protein